MTRVVAPSRLHFGLLHVPVEGLTHWPDGLPVRCFGGVGLMVQEPAVVVRVEPATDWSGVGPSADRAVGFVRRFVNAFPVIPPARFRVAVEACPPEHTGLGVGTQLGLAVGKAVAAELDVVVTPVEMAKAVGRGMRSGVGVHGFDRGGLILDGGKVVESAVGRPICRIDFPTDWPIVLARPVAPAGWSGVRERQAFARPRPSDAVLRTTEQMCRVALLGLVPAVLDRDAVAFGDALFEYNRLAGEAFADEQGGIYGGPDVAAVVAHVRALGVRGVGQSSWGPTVFAICPDPDTAAKVAASLKQRFLNLEAVTCTAARNTGAEVLDRL